MNLRRTAYIDVDGKCIIGMQKRAMMPLIIFDAIVNFYLNVLFIIPLRSESIHVCVSRRRG